MKIEAVIEQHAHHFLVGIKAECNGDREAGLIIEKYVREGRITEPEEHLLKVQLMDSLKIIGIGVPFVLLPGASVLMPILIHVAAKHHIELMPSAFTDREDTPQSDKQP